MKLFDWLTLRDYEEAKADGVRRVVARFARGNVLTQNRRYLVESETQELIARGDRAMTQLERASGAR